MRRALRRNGAFGACGKHEEARETIERTLAVNANFTTHRYAGYVRVLAGLRQAGLLDG